MSHQDRIDDTRPHPRMRAFQRSTPYVSWASLLAVLGIIATLISGQMPFQRDAQGSNAVSMQEIRQVEAQLQDHAQKIHDNNNSVQDIKESQARLIQGQQDQQQQISDLDYKTTRILELMLENKALPDKDGRHR